MSGESWLYDASGKGNMSGKVAKRMMRGKGRKKENPRIAANGRARTKGWHTSSGFVRSPRSAVVILTPT
jgi:hypothetical protein